VHLDAVQKSGSNCVSLVFERASLLFSASADRCSIPWLSSGGCTREELCLPAFFPFPSPQVEDPFHFTARWQGSPLPFFFSVFVPPRRKRKDFSFLRPSRPKNFKRKAKKDQPVPRSPLFWQSETTTRWKGPPNPFFFSLRPVAGMERHREREDGNCFLLFSSFGEGLRFPFFGRAANRGRRRWHFSFPFWCGTWMPRRNSDPSLGSAGAGRAGWEVWPMCHKTNEQCGQFPPPLFFPSDDLGGQERADEEFLGLPLKRAGVQ